MNKELKDLYLKFEEKYFYQKEYLSSINQFLNSISNYYETLEDNNKLSIIESLLIPDRIITFKVPWTDDLGNKRVNIGYRVQHNNAIGVYKGGTRFVKDLNESVLKFLAFEQTFKNALTNLPLGGAKGGSDFNPLNKSDLEKKRFSQSYMIELHKYIGPNIDVPAGDLGVTYKDIAHMYGIYKRITNFHDASFTSKHISYGGSLLRPESTGYGISYITEKAYKLYNDESLENKTVVISGSGQVGINTAYKMRELNAKLIAMSSIYGVIYDENGIDVELVDKLNRENKNIKEYLKKHKGAKYFKDTKEIWNIKCDIAIPCATQYELDINDATKLVNNKVKLIVEGSNKPSTNEAIKYFYDNKIVLVPSKVANAGGVIVSNLEMEQNQTFKKWDSLTVDNKLKEIMYTTFNNLYQKSLKLEDKYNLEKAANILAFKYLYDAIKLQDL